MGKVISFHRKDEHGALLGRLLETAFREVAEEIEIVAKHRADVRRLQRTLEALRTGTHFCEDCEPDEE